MAQGKFFPEVTKKQVMETGILIILICIIMGLYHQNFLWFKIALGTTLLTLLAPRIFYPVAVVWFAFGQVISRISSVALLTLLFVLLVIPIALLKRLFGKDSPKLVHNLA